MTERRECCLCGATSGTIRLEMFRRLVFEPGQEYDSGLRCLDRDRCKAEVDFLHQANPEVPEWNVADGPAVMPRIASQRAYQVASPVLGPPAPPAIVESKPSEEPERHQQDPGPSMGLWR